jgi:hypothetical protein
MRLALPYGRGDMNGFPAAVACLILITSSSACTDREGSTSAGQADTTPVETASGADSISPVLLDTSMVYEGQGFSIEVRYPPVALEIPGIGDSLSAYSDRVEGPFRAMLEERSPEEMGWSLSVYYSHLPSPSGLVCILASIYEYSGGAHGMNWDVSFVYDLERRAFIDPVSLLGDSTSFASFASAARDTLLARFSVDADTAWVEQGTVPASQNYQALLPVPDSTGGIAGFRVVFSPYQVAPYAFGSQEVLVRI